MSLLFTIDNPIIECMAYVVCLYIDSIIKTTSKYAGYP